MMVAQFIRGGSCIIVSVAISNSIILSSFFRPLNTATRQDACISHVCVVCGSNNSHDSISQRMNCYTSLLRIEVFIFGPQINTCKTNNYELIKLILINKTNNYELIKLIIMN